MSSLRSKTIDIAKGILIILVVCGHCGIWETKIYYFHMAAFFIISGYTISSKYYKDTHGLVSFCKKRIISLWIPYVAVNIPLILLHNSLIRLNIYTADKAFLFTEGIGNQYGLKEFYSNKEIAINIVKCLLFCHSEQLAGTTWFLRTLFITSVVIVTLLYLCNRFLKITDRILLYIQCAIGVAMLMFGFYFNYAKAGISPTVISLSRQLFYTHILLAIGMCVKSLNLLDRIEKQPKASVVIMFVAALPIVIYNGGYISLGNNEIINPYIYMLLSVSGTAMVLCMASLFSSVSIFSSTLAKLGKNSLAIMIWHLSAFKLVNMFQIVCYNFPTFYLACFPTLKTDPFWWKIVYLSVGCLIPLVLNIGYNRVVGINRSSKN